MRRFLHCATLNTVDQSLLSSWEERTLLDSWRVPVESRMTSCELRLHGDLHGQKSNSPAGHDSGHKRHGQVGGSSLEDGPDCCNRVRHQAVLFICLLGALTVYLQRQRARIYRP